ncbi:unnamed protein product [Oppiella nova]|uniref:MIP18 family-like domain-containing protein n=1 Tax=Oppiella nova TaxID=334625 RepID=A0A7R9MBE8_9ACAR|nr:unnamed protein product [Oppiella nova]CAG2174284.1 unnamed protein product [Oppiella nova]
MKSTERQTTTEGLDSQRVFELIRDIRDPELPSTLEDLKVVSEGGCEVDGYVCRVCFTPSKYSCPSATIIGLSIHIKLIRALPKCFKIDVFVAPGSHVTEEDVNKQLADKERVAAALENPQVLDLVEQLIV